MIVLRDLLEGSKLSGRRRVDSVQSVGMAMQALDENLDKLDGKGVSFDGVTCKAPTADRSDWLLTIRATVNGEKVIAFMSGYTLAEAMDKGLRDFAAGKLRWKVDSYAK
jgi:hypothetical protein